MLHVSETLTSRFSRRFDIFLADTDSLRQRVYQVRHRVFCQELGFAMQSDGEFETNEYDDHSLQLLMRDRFTNTDIACVRVVEPLKRGGGLPFEAFGLRYIDRKLLDWKKLDPMRCCELSRLAILESVRRPSSPGADAPECGDIAIAKDLRALIPVALSYAGLSLSLARDYEWIFMGGELRLQRFITRYGLNSRQISPLFDYYGQRAIFVLSRNQLLADMRKWKPEWLGFYRYIDNKLTGGLEDVMVARAS